MIIYTIMWTVSLLCTANEVYSLVISFHTHVATNFIMCFTDHINQEICVFAARNLQLLLFLRPSYKFIFRNQYVVSQPLIFAMVLFKTLSTKVTVTFYAVNISVCGLKVFCTVITTYFYCFSPFMSFWFWCITSSHFEIHSMLKNLDLVL